MTPVNMGLMEEIRRYKGSNKVKYKAVNGKIKQKIITAKEMWLDRF